MTRAAESPSNFDASAPAGETAPDRIPVGVLVGYLGSGKSTTLNYLLRGVHGKKIAVIVNEFGEIDLDSQVVAREVRAGAELISLANQCICCKLRGDLLDTVKDLTERNDLDYILVESTGLGEAAPIAQTFFAGGLDQQVRLDAMITVVDAAHFWETYQDATAEGKIEGEEHAHSLAHLLAGQIEFADIVLLNKIDLVPVEEVTRLESFIWELNPRANVIRTRYGQVDPSELLYTGAFDVNQVADTEEWQEAERDLLHDEHGDEDEDEDHDHDDHDDEEDSFGFTSFVYETPLPFDLDRLKAQVFACWSEVAPGVARSKGTIQVAGTDQVLFWNQAGRRVSLEVVGQWPEGGVRGSQVVVIGREVDRDALAAHLDACTVDAGMPATPALPAGGREEVALG